MMATVVGTARRALKWEHSPRQAWLAALMVAIVGVLLVAHVAEVLTWSLAYAALDVVPTTADVLYFAFVNYTTLGYGDVVPVEHWRLLGPMAAMNGVLLFGWSTAVIFEVMRQAMRIHDQKSEL
jgi:polyferredoxin